MLILISISVQQFKKNALLLIKRVLTLHLFQTFFKEKGT